MSGPIRTATWKLVPPPLRQAAFGILVVLGGVLLFWIQRNTWRQLERLQADYALVTGQSFYVGVNLRTAVRTMNNSLLDSALHRDGSGWADFLKESGEVQGLLATNRVLLRQLSELDLVRRDRVEEQEALLGRSEKALGRYLARVQEELAPDRKPSMDHRFEAAYVGVRDASEDLFELCRQLVSGENMVLEEFLAGTHQTLEEHERLLKVSSGLTIGLALLLAGVVYRATIAPLHERLNESQAVIARQEKLASLGVLAAGVAHEIRNPLTAIKFRLFSLRRTLPEAYAADEDLGVIAGELTRLERIVRDFLQFARPSDPAMVRLPAGRLLEEVGELLGAELEAARVRLVLEPFEEAWIRADAQQMKQVLINLVRNAAESIEPPGSVTLRVQHGSGSAGAGGGAGRSVVFSVRDTGRGIPPEVERRLFDPFFSTKEGGTGLGLSIASRIVEKHGGTLRYVTAMNRGTTFEIVLPGLDDDVSETSDHRG
jgi:signal transduction histidine kinase